MKTSNLAERLEEFEATLESLKQEPPHIVAVADRETPPRAPRLSLTTRRIQIRDPGLSPFRVY